MKRHSRREFLSEVIHGTVAAGAGLMVLDPLLGLVAKAQLPPAITTDKRSSTAGKFGMELDGQFAGWVESVAGGHAVADTVIEKVGSGQIQRKHIAGVKYEDVTINCGTGMSKSFYDWIKASFDNKQPVPKNGAIITADYNNKAHSRMEFFNGVVTEIGFPACDAGSKDPAKMTIKFAPESTRTTVANPGVSYDGGYKNNQTLQKKWLPSNFRLKIDGLDCTQVRKIEAVTAKFASGGNQVGAARLQSSMAPPAPSSNLVITVPESRQLSQWYEDFVVRGDNRLEKQRNGMLEFLSPDLKESFFWLSFRNLAILKLLLSPLQAGSAASRMVTAEMSCNGIRFDYSSSGWA